MPADSDRPAGSLAVPRPAGPGDPRWRILLESRWRARLLEVTELSLAYHDAAAAPVLSTGPADGGPAGGRPAGGLRRLLNRAVGARRALADTEEALVRLAAGQFGRCSVLRRPAPQLAGNLRRGTAHDASPRPLDRATTPGRGPALVRLVQTIRSWNTGAPSATFWYRSADAWVSGSLEFSIADS